MIIKKGVNYFKTEHRITLVSGTQRVEAFYAVISIKGIKKGIPSESAIVWLMLNRKTGHFVDNFISLPFDNFIELFEPVSDSDKFWEEEKNKM